MKVIDEGSLVRRVIDIDGACYGTMNFDPSGFWFFVPKATWMSERDLKEILDILTKLNEPLNK